MGKGECCCCLLFLVYFVGFTAFIIGTVSPRWYSTGINTGVFFICAEGDKDIVWNSEHCDWIDLTEEPTWWQASAGLLAAAVLVGLVALFVAMIIPVTAALQILAGGLGVSGSILWMVKFMDTMNQDFDSPDDLDTKGQWGFILAVAGSALMFLNGVVVAIFACCSGCHCSAMCCCCPRKSRY